MLVSSVSSVGEVDCCCRPLDLFRVLGIHASGDPMAILAEERLTSLYVLSFLVMSGV